jgi:hypothetical protein
MPVIHQFILMQNGPRQYQVKLLLWQSSLNDPDFRNINFSRVISIFNMKVRRHVLTIVHRNLNTVKPAQLHHASSRSSVGASYV